MSMDAVGTADHRTLISGNVIDGVPVGGSMSVPAMDRRTEHEDAR